MTDSATFYSDLPVHEAFEALTSADAYTALPDDWLVGLADIVGSSQAVADGRYKTVNTVGAAVISAQINAADGQGFPYVFGGDGAAFAVPESHEAAARKALSEVRGWAQREFDFDLRVALVPVSVIRAAGRDVRVGRYRAAREAVYAMFEGGGVAWAEERMKAGENLIPAAPDEAMPDLTGLSCRWTPMKARAGAILSVLIVPTEDADRAIVDAALRDVITLTSTLDRSGHPVPPEGPGYRWIPEGIDLEARATHGTMSVAKRKAQLLVETFIAWLFHITGASVGGFSARHYTATTGANADFRKFDDGLKMTIDCDAATRAKLEARLSQAQAEGILRYAMLEQDSAIMTCIVPSVTQDDHIHFVDGAQGGYTKAAASLKTAN